MTKLNKGGGNGQHLLVVLINGPAGFGIEEVVAILKGLVQRSINQAVSAHVVLHIQVRPTLINRSQRSSEMTQLALLQSIQFLDAGNIGRALTLGRLVVRDGQNLEILLVSSYNAIHVVNTAIGGRSYIKGVVEEGAVVAVSIGKGAAVSASSNGHVLEQHIVCPVSVIHLVGSDHLGSQINKFGCCLETLGALQLGMVVIGGLGSAETCGNDVTNLVGLARALINESVTGVILDIHVNT